MTILTEMLAAPKGTETTWLKPGFFQVFFILPVLIVAGPGTELSARADVLSKGFAGLFCHRTPQASSRAAGQHSPPELPSPQPQLWQFAEFNSRPVQ